MPLNIGIQAVVPGRRLKTKDFEAAIERALIRTANQVQAEFKKTTRTWLTQVDFYITRVYRTSAALYINIGTDNEIYRYVSRGTKPHVIKPKKSRVLAYSSGYRPKTRIGRISSSAGGSFGNSVFSGEVNHPGTTGRRFEELIAKKHQNTLQKNVNDEMKKSNR